ILDVDSLQRLFSDFLQVGGNRCHLLAGEANYAVSEHGHVIDLPANLDGHDVETCDGGPYSREAQCFVDVNSFDPAVRDGTSQHLAPWPTRKRHIDGVQRFAGNLLDAFCSGHRKADPLFSFHGSILTSEHLFIITSPGLQLSIPVRKPSRRDVKATPAVSATTMMPM